MDNLIPLLVAPGLGALALLAGSVSIVKQDQVGVAVLFGRYRRLLQPGLNFRIPFVETLMRTVSLQHRSAELEFQAITVDQANVTFKALILYAVRDDREETIKKAAFRFLDEKSFMQSLIRSIEGSIRSFVASKRQNEVLGLRTEIVQEVKAHIDEELDGWGFHLINLQINDITFDEAIMRSMAQVVASTNMLLAAQNEAQAQYVTKTRVAEAEAQSRRLVAAADRDADELRGEGSALHHKRVAEGLAEAGNVTDAGGVPPSFLLYMMWIDTMKNVAAHSHGNVLSFDGSMDGFNKTMRQVTLLQRGDHSEQTEHS